MRRKLRMGMVGGGPGAFIGEVHRRASRLDGRIDLMAGAFDIDPEKSLEMGTSLCVAPDRTYREYKEMIEKELQREDPVDFITIVTPNNWHFPIAKECLEAGFNVMCEKPMTMTLAEAKELKSLVDKTGKVFGLMHNYTGYPMVKLAKDMVKLGDLGEILKIVVQYPQEWLARPIEKEGQQQASWRTDPKQSGVAGCMGDIGTHAANLAEYISGLSITEICADLTTFIDGRLLDDDGNCLLRFNNGAKGLLQASQVSIGTKNDLAIWVYGTDKSVEWHQERPNQLLVKGLGTPVEIWDRAYDYVTEKSAAAARCTRIPTGHPEAFFEAFANNYLNFSDTIFAALEGETPNELALDFPGVDAGVRGMAFIETVVESAASEKKWTSFKV
ncbi:MAG: Gfo/Idh/MocA family oxidoreductase [Kiritimatiellaeota bacterium]|nr:Gfo/Idh/MocA family oxidoreductase [Kiritimatiellota bacterium]